MVDLTKARASCQFTAGAVLRTGVRYCKQTKYALRNQLSAVLIQAQTNAGDWQTVRSYSFTSAVNAGVTIADRCSSDNHYC